MLPTDKNDLSTIDFIVRQWRKERPDLNLAGFEILARIRGLALLTARSHQLVAASFGLSAEMMWLLYALRREGHPYQLRPTDIFKLLNVTSGTITYRIDKLEKTGFVKRVSDPQDRRSTLIQLTQNGIETIDKAVEVMANEALVLFKNVIENEKDVNDLESLFNKIGLALDQSIPPDENPLLHHTQITKK